MIVHLAANLSHDISFRDSTTTESVGDCGKEENYGRGDYLRREGCLYRVVATTTTTMFSIATKFATLDYYFILYFNMSFPHSSR